MLKQTPKTRRLVRAALVSSVAVISLGFAGSAMAGGTQAGSNVQNTFTLNYTVSGVAQPTIDTGPAGTNTPTEFTVDRLVDLTVTSQGDTNVAPGAQDQQLVFSVTNDGNDTQAYDLSVFNESGDDFDASNLVITYYIDDGDGVFEPGVDDGAAVSYTLGTSTSDLGFTPESSPGAGDADNIMWVVIEGDIPTGATVADADVATLTLVADTVAPGTAGAASVQVDDDSAVDGVNQLTGLDNVLADGSSGARENANEGDESATADYIVTDPDVTASKAVTVFSQDGTGCATIPGTPVAGSYSVPGACVEYVITVNNTGATATASAIAVVDTLPDELEFIAATTSGFTGGSFSPALPAANTDCTGGACVISFTGADLAASTTATVTIRALVQ